MMNYLFEPQYGPWYVEGTEVRVVFRPRARLVARRRGRELASLPANVRRSPEMAAVLPLLRAAALRSKVLCGALERCMLAGTPLTELDMRLLRQDPAGGELVRRVVFRAGDEFGVPGECLDTLLGPWGEAVSATSPWRIPHPLDLAACSRLDEWNSWLNRAAVRQPFAQVRRRCFHPTTEELHGPGEVLRWADTVVRWEQARAILEKSGWPRITRAAAECPLRNGYLSARLEFSRRAVCGNGPARVRLRRLCFVRSCPGEACPSTNSGAAELVGIAAIEPAEFSETLRAVELVAAVCGSREQIAP